MNCAFCREELKGKEKLAKGDTCPHCGRDLHCCLQCKFYDPHAYNECREVRARKIVDKRRANNCDFFVPRGSTSKNINQKAEAKRALDALFKK